jgi:hypothetical protein
LEEEGTTVAPPERDARSLTSSSYLPPAPSISSSRARQEREPITKGKSIISKDSEDFTNHSDSDSGNEESSSPSPNYSTIKIGPPVGRRRTMPTKSISPQREGDTDFAMASPDQERVKSTTKPRIIGL